MKQSPLKIKTRGNRVKKLCKIVLLELHKDRYGAVPLLLADNGEDLYNYIEDFRQKTTTLKERIKK
jgi:hypothetical protein